ncbi:glycosyltransferase 87 family protein [Streptomyces sp. NPDC002889]|uniref:glycosyltransferase 87 family protein n=1 Tax=Streptomyces sp. NPDC002889 TaxID=3364669 RepID=UPI0036C5CC6B
MRRARTVVLSVSAVAFVAKVVIAAQLPGPADVRFFGAFARAISQVGPLRIYEHPMPRVPVYNHPPLASWMLLGMDELDRLGIPFAFLIRTPACLADFVSAVLVFEILRRRRTVKAAMACALGCALSPLLITTSGYHGNTDSVAIMFAVAAAYLLVDRRSPLAAGISAAVAVSIKLIPVVAIPALIVAAARAGRPALTRFAAGLGAVLLLLWGPVLATVPVPLREKVLEYKGGRTRMWGFVRFSDWLGLSDAFILALHENFHLLFVLLCMAAGAWLAWMRPTAPAHAVGLSLTLLLLLSTGSAVQYLAWPVVGLFLFGLWEGTAFSVVVGIATVLVYRGASAVRWSETALSLTAVGWWLLAAGIATGVRRVLAAPPTPSAPARAPVVAPRAEPPATPASPVN